MLRVFSLGGRLFSASYAAINRAREEEEVAKE